MTSFELIRNLIKRCINYSWLIAIIGLLAGYFLYRYAKNQPTVYTSKFTVFPLNATNDNSVSASSISSLLGIGDVQKSFGSEEASINIVELANSRRTREAVLNTRLKQFNDEKIATLLINEENKTNVKIDSTQLMKHGGLNLQTAFTAKIGKLGVLELTFTNTNKDLVRNISYIYIEKIREFYIDLKKKKAQLDFEFSVAKADSLKRIMDGIDKEIVKLDQSTYFTNFRLSKFSIPRENIEREKQNIQSQYYYAVRNRESAAYKLQKVTPVIEILDTPEEPYNEMKKSGLIYGLIGFVAGVMLGLIIVCWSIISKYINNELNQAIIKAEQKAKAQQQANAVTNVEPQQTSQPI
jgi:hypothetical protein